MRYLIVAAFAAMSFLSVPKSKTDIPPVFIVEQSAMHPTNCTDNDPLMPVCTFARVVVENRSRKPIIATIECGADESEVEIPARLRITVDFEITVFVAQMNCNILRWQTAW